MKAAQFVILPRAIGDDDGPQENHQFGLAVQPLVLGKSRVQMIDIDAVCGAILMCLETDSLDRRDVDLVDSTVHSLADLTLAIRKWHGFAAPIAILPVPRFIGAALARLGDAAGWLGWRTPLRTTSLLSLQSGVVGDAAPSQAFPRDNSFASALRKRPATRQDRLFPRMQLLLPLVVLGLSAFWIVSKTSASGALAPFPDP